jgi:hypothetical protein
VRAQPGSRSAAPTSTQPPPAPNEAEEDEGEVSLALQAAQTLEDLEGLAQRFPENPQVWVTLARQHANKNDFGRALTAAERATSLSGQVRQDGKLATVLWLAAQSEESRRAFELLRGMGASGADIFLDLATTATVRQPIRDKARAELASSRFQAAASSDAKAAAALFLAPDCQARKAQLPQARRQGRQRTLRLLEAYERGEGCKSKEDRGCGDCLRGSPELASARAEIQKQLDS